MMAALRQLALIGAVLRRASAIASLSIAVGVSAAPHLPTDDAQVLEHLPGRNTTQYRELKALQTAAARHTEDLSRAAPLAAAYIRAARIEGDPRFLGYAQAALSPWWKDPNAPTQALVLRATILQSSHRFDAAVADLDRVSQRDPRNAQAALTRATVLTVQGKYAQARKDCDHLFAIPPQIYATICIAAIDSLSGKSAAAYELLQQALTNLPRSDGTVLAWGETLLGEIAHRRNDPAAERHFRAAMNAADRDIYLLGAYADWLLDQRRPADVVALLQNETRVDALLLRLALAQKALNRPEAAASIETLRARFDASHARGDTVHQRENARFELALGNDPRSALLYALANWQVQREPADIRILAEAAVAANDAAGFAEAKRWLAETRLEYAAVTALVASSEVPAK
jgi:Tfp pilus assembly protein PilF